MYSELGEALGQATQEGEDAPSLEMLTAKLDEALGNPI